MSVDVLLVRHAIAWERDHSRWPDDRKRPLTPEGRKKFEKAAAGLRTWIPQVDRLITSPLTRAAEPRLFEQPHKLRLEQTDRYDNGVVYLNYEPEG